MQAKSQKETVQFNEAHILVEDSQTQYFEGSQYFDTVEQGSLPEGRDHLIPISQIVISVTIFEFDLVDEEDL